MDKYCLHSITVVASMCVECTLYYPSAGPFTSMSPLFRNVAEPACLQPRPFLPLSPSTCVCSPAPIRRRHQACVFVAPPLSPSTCVCSAAETSSLDDDLEKRRAERKAAREARLRA